MKREIGEKVLVSKRRGLGWRKNKEGERRRGERKKRRRGEPKMGMKLERRKGMWRETGSRPPRVRVLPFPAESVRSGRGR